MSVVLLTFEAPSIKDLFTYRTHNQDDIHEWTREQINAFLFDIRQGLESRLLPEDWGFEDLPDELCQDSVIELYLDLASDEIVNEIEGFLPNYELVAVVPVDGEGTIVAVLSNPK